MPFDFFFYYSVSAEKYQSSYCTILEAHFYTKSAARIGSRSWLVVRNVVSVSTIGTLCILTAVDVLARVGILRAGVEGVIILHGHHRPGAGTV